MNDDLEASEPVKLEPGQDMAIGCLRVRDMNDGTDYAFEKVVDCEGGCGWPVIVSKEGIAFAEAHVRHKYICLQCALKDGEAKFSGGVPGSIDAVASITGESREKISEDLAKMIAMSKLVASARRAGKRR